MEFYEREFLLSKILYGSTIIDLNKDLRVYVHPLTIEQNLFAQRVFQKAYEESLFSGVFTRKEMLELMEEQGVWSEEKEKRIKETQKKIENLKLSIYENFLHPSRREDTRLELREEEKELLNFYKEKHQNDHLDCEGIATYSRLCWVIENTTTYEDGTPYPFDEVSINLILKFKGDQTAEIGEYREIARTEPWRGIWTNSDQDVEKAFQKTVFELTDEQDQLIGWTRLYDNVGEAYESPPDNIIEDDDALDGWLVRQKRDREKEQNQYKQDGLDNKHPGADEVFIITNSKEETKEVYDLNDGEGQFVVASRRASLDQAKKKNKEHGIQYHKFRDVKIRAMNEGSNRGNPAL